MKKILVPVDFSGHTGIICRYAIEFAKIFGGEIRLFHSCFDQMILADASFPDTIDMSTIYSEQLMKGIYLQAETRLKELHDQLRQELDGEGLPHIILSTRLTGGDFELELRGICQDYHPDMVILGTTGSGKNLNVWGKVSTFIIEHARVPVLTVPAITGFPGLGNVMFTADLSEQNVDCIRLLLNLFEPLRIMIRVVHFFHKTGENDAENRMKMLRDSFSGEEKEGRIAFDLVETTDDNQSAIGQFITQAEIRMIAFNPHRHGLLYMYFTRKITRKNLFATHIPLLSVPGT
ncbi:MAG TPA: universal stress protein [Bacteroidales bacterium]|nr:universal stress protein [Bacteroidales bacterium]